MRPQRRAAQNTNRATFVIILLATIVLAVALGLLRFWIYSDLAGPAITPPAVTSPGPPPATP